ncbi:MAG: hypothetical protein ACUVTD_06480 [Nitrososphaerales archaeon]
MLKDRNGRCLITGEASIDPKYIKRTVKIYNGKRYGYCYEIPRIELTSIDIDVLEKAKRISGGYLSIN